MKTTEKILLGTGIVLAAGGLGYLAYRSYKKEKRIILKETAKENAELEKLGINPEYAREEIIEEVDDDNLVKQLFIAAYGSRDFDSDVLIKALDPDPEDVDKPMIYVSQSDYKGKKSLDIYLEIPYIPAGSFLTMRDFNLAGKQLAKDLWNELKFVDEPHHCLRGIMILEYSQDPDGERIQRAFRLPEFFHSAKEWTEDSKTSGLEEFVKAVQENKKEAKQQLLENLITGLSEVFPNGGNICNPRVVNIFLTYKISFGIMNESKEPGLYNFGVNLKMGIDILKHIVHNFKVLGTDRMGNVKDACIYDRIIFSAPGPDGNWSFLRHYDKDDEGHVYIDEFYWD